MHPALETLRDSSQPRLIEAALGELWRDMRVTAAASLVVGHYTQQIVAAKARYMQVGVACSVPWPIVGILHHLEAGGSFRHHLHNGDSLAARTTHVPAGRPKEGNPPFKWEDSAVDALRYDGLHHLKEGWSRVGAALNALERYNGLGYRRRGIASPYLWAGSNHYTAGKYTADGKFDPRAVSAQIGAAILMKAFVSLRLLTLNE